MPPPTGKQQAAAADSAAAPDAAPAPKPGRVARLRNLARRGERLLMLGAGALIAVAIVYGNSLLHPQSRELTQEDIDGAVMHTLETKTLPSQAARAYEAPDRLDLQRHGVPHLSFGFGAHICLGFPLARLEGQIALPALLARWKTIELAAPRLEWIDSMVLRGMKAMPLRVRH